MLVHKGSLAGKILLAFVLVSRRVGSEQEEEQARFNLRLVFLTLTKTRIYLTKLDRMKREVEETRAKKWSTSMYLPQLNGLG